LIRLGEKQETDNPFGRGAGYVEEGTFTVKADDGRLSAVLNAAAYSHSFYGVPSLSVASVQLVQEFEVVAGDPNRGTVELTLAAKMLGTIRTERNEKATGAIRVADAAIAVPGGSPFVWVAFPPYERSGVASERYEREVVAPPVRLPAGRYVLIANLVLATEVDACLRGHVEVIFAPPSERGSWKSEDNPPPKPKSKEGFRFGLVIGASVSPG
jgi:hypothetical protein